MLPVKSLAIGTLCIMAAGAGYGAVLSARRAVDKSVAAYEAPEERLSSPIAESDDVKLRVPATPCNDSDGGDFPSTAGYVIDTTGAIYVDRCLASGYTVVETICGTNGIVSTVNHSCANPCAYQVINVPPYGPMTCAYCPP
jgi:hypothetical protein